MQIEMTDRRSFSSFEQIAKLAVAVHYQYYQYIY